MDYFPAFLDLNQRRCLVVGGGEVALRKVRLLLNAGARITLQAQTVSDALHALVEKGDIDWVEQNWQEQSLKNFWLIIAATADPRVNGDIACAAEKEGRWCNVVDDAELSAFIVPAIVDRSPVTVAVSSAGRSPVLARVVKARIEKLLSPRLSLVAEFAGRWRKSVMQTLTNSAIRRRFWERILSGEVAELVLNMQPDKAARLMKRELSGCQSHSAMRQKGKAYIVGAGPGDAGLITVRGRTILETADVVLYDRLVSSELLEIARRDADLIYVGKQAGGESTSQEEINRLLVEQVSKGLRVCRLKGGDPFLFGRGGEEVAALRERQLAFEIVPGITAAAGCAAYAGVPLTHRGLADKVTLITAQGQWGEPYNDWSSLAQPGQTLVFYMAVTRYRHIATKLMQAGLAGNKPCAIVSHGTTKNQRVIITALAQLAVSVTDLSLSPAVLIVGDVAAQAQRNSWFGDVTGAALEGIPEMSEVRRAIPTNAQAVKL